MAPSDPPDDGGERKSVFVIAGYELDAVNHYEIGEGGKRLYQPFGTVDYIALSYYDRRPAGSCKYVDSKGKKIERERYRTSVEVAVFDRRSGEKVESKTLKSGKAPKCADMVSKGDARRALGAKIRPYEITKWVREKFQPK